MKRTKWKWGKEASTIFFGKLVWYAGNLTLIGGGNSNTDTSYRCKKIFYKLYRLV